MTIERRIANLAGLNNEAWDKHSSGLSVWTRFSGPVLLITALWSRLWLGWWALLALGLVIVWIALNPHIFPRAKDRSGYTVRGAWGERIWMHRDVLEVPAKHKGLPHFLSVVNSLGFAAALYGAVLYDPWTAALGLSTHYLGKAWFIDRMVWLTDDMSALGRLGEAEAIIKAQID